MFWLGTFVVWLALAALCVIVPELHKATEKKFGHERNSIYWCSAFFVGAGAFLYGWKGAALVSTLIALIALDVRYVRPVIDRWKQRRYEKDWARRKAELQVLDASIAAFYEADAKKEQELNAYLDEQEQAARSRLVARQELRQAVGTLQTDPTLPPPPG